MSVVLHCVPFTADPTVNTSVLPPVPNPVESDMVIIIFWLDGNGNCSMVYSPAPLLNEVSGMDRFRGVPKTCKS